jgi:hypothetical protein
VIDKVECCGPADRIGLRPQHRLCAGLLLTALCGFGCKTGDGGSGDAATKPPCSVSTSAADNIPICCGHPGEVPSYNCLPWSLVESNLRNCVMEGAHFDGHFAAFGLACCSGLSNVAGVGEADGSTGLGLPAGCNFPLGPPGLQVCIRCGDGTCGPGENRCNCAKDCQRI